MTNEIWNKSAAAMIVAAAVLLTGCDANTLELSGEVRDIYASPLEPCELVYPDDGEDDDGDGVADDIEPEDWPIQVKGKFRLEKTGDVYKFVVKDDPDNVLGKADMIAVNENDRAMRWDYCYGGGPVSEHPYALGIVELDQSHEPPRLRALVYFPMRLKYRTPRNSADTFYLMLMEVQEKEQDCDSEVIELKQMRLAAGAAADESTDSSDVRCRALSRLGALYREQAAPGIFRQALKKEIRNILPDDPDVVTRFHNGVIHGNF